MWENVKGMLALPDDPAQRSAAKQGLLAAGAAMMSGNGNFIGMLGQGLGAGANTYQGALAQQQQAALQRAQQQRWELENKQTQAALAKPALISSALAGVRDPASQGSIASSSAPTQVATATAPTPRRAPPLDASLEGNTVRSFADLPRVDQPPTPQPTATLPPVASPEYLFNYYRQRGDALMGIDVDAAKMQYDLAEKQRRKLKEQRALTVDGKRVLANVFEDGTTQQLDGFAPDLEKLNFQNTGGATVGLDPFTGKSVNTIANTVSPDARLRAAQDERESLRTDKRLREAQEEKEPKFFVSNGLMGKEFLASLDKPTADQVRALADGRMAFPTGKALQSAYWQKMLSAVSQYDPSFDAVNYGARAKARNDLTAGKTGENIKAINTAIAHIGQLDDQMTALDNTTSPAYNAAMNWKATHLWGADRQEKLAAVSATAEGVAGEMAKVFRSTGMSVHEIDAWRQKFAESITPAQQRGTMQAAMHMLQGRMEAIQDQYKTGMGTTSEPLNILTPEAETVFKKLSGPKVKGLSELPKKKQSSGHPSDITDLLGKYGSK